MATEGAWTRSTWTDAAQVVAAIDPDACLDGARGRQLHEWYDQILAAGDFPRAIEFLAHALSRYDCVAWAARSAIAAGLIDRSDPLMVMVLQWIDSQEDSIRRAAGDAAQAMRGNSPAKLLGLAVFFSGGSLAPPEQGAVLPPPDICARMATASLLTGCYARPDPDAAMREVLELGETMVAG